MSASTMAQLGFDSPLPLLAPLSDTQSTPDSVGTPDSFWPYDTAPDPNELHDFILAADDDGRLAFAFDGDADVDSPQPSLAIPLLDSPTAEEEVRGAPYAAVRSSKSKRVVCQSACVRCRKAKTRCDGQRPCARCTSHDKTDECVDRPAEEVERGKQNRKRKPKLTNNTARTAPATTLGPALPLSPLPAVTLSLPYDSPAAKLALGQSAILRQSIIDRVNRLYATRAVDDEGRRRFIRAVHLLLVKKADATSATEFDLFINGRLPGTHSNGPLQPLPACLRLWARVETRPLYLDWSISPTVCEADETADALPTVRIRTGPTAQRALERWESVQRMSEERQQPTTAVSDEAVQPIEEIFSCLGVADPVEVSQASSVVQAPPPSGPLHAPWCPVRSGTQLPFASASFDDAVSPPAPLPCVCFAAAALPTALSVNAAWERLFGYSQAEVRLQLMRRGSAIMTDWYVADSWWAMHSLLASHALTDKRYGYRVRAFVVVRTRWGTELPCMLEKVIVEDQRGHSQAIQTVTPLAQLSTQLLMQQQQPAEHEAD